MVIRAFIGIGILFFLHSCAQVATLTGGEKDKVAPKPIEEKMEPLNGTTNFKGSEIKIPFSEFVKLDNPAETMVMIPPHAKLKASVHGKTVTINWSDTLHENTTYAIYLNETVKDITEGNDSLMQIVFSTGNTIDSLSYQVKVIDAFTSEPIKNCLVGLYTGETDSIKPTYFVKTAADGKAKFKYLKSGSYTLLAFDDKSKDMFLQPGERLAFRKDLLQMDSSIVDTIPLRLYTPKEKERLRSFVFKPPGSFLVGANASLKNADLIFNQETVLTMEYDYITDDSLVIYKNPGDSSNMELIATTKAFTDTISLRIQNKERGGKLTYSSNLTDQFLLPKDTLVLYFTDLVTSVNTNLMQLINKEDSTAIELKKVTVDRNRVYFVFDKKNLKLAELLILPKGVITNLSTLNDSLKVPIKLKEESDYGSIKLDVSGYSTPIIVDVLMNGKTVRSLPFQGTKTVLLETLLPNDYTFRVILDDNKNGRWDIGERTSNTYPELIHTFSQPTKVRANWEIEVKLAPTN